MVEHIKELSFAPVFLNQLKSLRLHLDRVKPFGLGSAKLDASIFDILKTAEVNEVYADKKEDEFEHIPILLLPVLQFCCEYLAKHIQFERTLAGFLCPNLKLSLIERVPGCDVVPLCIIEYGPDVTEMDIPCVPGRGRLFEELVELVEPVNSDVLESEAVNVLAEGTKPAKCCEVEFLCPRCRLISVFLQTLNKGNFRFLYWR